MKIPIIMLQSCVLLNLQYYLKFEMREINTFKNRYHKIFEY